MKNLAPHKAMWDFVAVATATHGLVRLGKAWRGPARCGGARLGMAWVKGRREAPFPLSG